MLLEISRQADADLSQILRAGFDSFGPVVAQDYHFSFGRTFALLKDRPRAGIAEPKLGPAVRSIKHRKHRIYYEIEADRIVVLRVLHAHRDVRRGFLREHG